MAPRNNRFLEPLCLQSESYLVKVAFTVFSFIEPYAIQAGNEVQPQTHSHYSNP